MFNGLSGSENDNYTMICGKRVFESDSVDGIEIHKCLNAYLVYIQMLRTNKKAQEYGQRHCLTISFPTFEELSMFLKAIYDDTDVGSSMVTKKFHNFIEALVPAKQM
jgi:hypothetical protein